METNEITATLESRAEWSPKKHLERIKPLNTRPIDRSANGIISKLSGLKKMNTRKKSSYKNAKFISAEIYKATIKSNKILLNAKNLQLNEQMKAAMIAGNIMFESYLAAIRTNKYDVYLLDKEYKDNEERLKNSFDYY